MISRWVGEPPLTNTITGAWLTAPPPEIDPKLNRTNDLITALGAIPPFPTYTLPPPPEGMAWDRASGATIEPSEALAGEWTPETRPHLAAIIQYLQDPNLEAALDQFAAIEPGVGRIAAFGQFRNLARIITARVRYRHAALDDIDGAVADLELIFRLSNMLARSGETLTWLTAVACEQLALEEAGRLAHEHQLSPQQATRLSASIQATVVHPEEVYKRRVELHFEELRRIVDSASTLDGEGNGWLAVNRLDEISTGAVASSPRSGAWNVLSFLFNDRRTIEAKIEKAQAQSLRASELPYAKAQEHMALLENRRTFTLADGPLCQLNHWLTPMYLKIVTRRATDQQGVLAVTTMSAYHYEHGEYPSSLSHLTGASLDDPPMDWFARRPLRYERLAGDKYRLYSVGENGQDDGGNSWQEIDGQRQRLKDDWDYPQPRHNTMFEPKLIKAGS